MPAGANERLIEEAGLRLVRREDLSGNAALISGRWRDARAAHRDQLIESEGPARFEAFQRFFDAVQRLSSERRLSRIAYLVERPRV